MRTPTTEYALAEIEAVAKHGDRYMTALSCLTKIEELSRHAGELGPAIYRACRSTPDATAAMKAVADLLTADTLEIQIGAA
jgi:hypothetical protein